MVDDVPSEWLRGLLEPCLLAQLSGGEAYGHELAKGLAAAGLGQIAGGSLYPALLRLERQGLVEAQWRPGERGPGRKYYRLTPLGRERVAEHLRRWDAFVVSVSRVLDAARTS